MRKHTLVSIALAFGWLGCTDGDPVGVAPDDAFSKDKVHYVPYRSESVDIDATAEDVDLDVDCASGELEIYKTTTGIGTHLGKFTGFMNSCFNLTTYAFHGKRVSIGANGDEIHSEFVGSYAVTPVTAEVTITGGTGRFVNAQNPPGEPLIGSNVDGKTIAVGRISSVGSSK